MKNNKHFEELAAKLINDYHEGIDGGESRDTWRKVAEFYATQSYYRFQDFRQVKDILMFAEIGIAAILPLLKGDKSKEAKAIRKIFKFVTDECVEMRKKDKKGA